MKPKFKKIIFKVGLIFLIVVVIGLSVRAFFNYRNGKTFEKYRTELINRGVLVENSELFTSCPEPENAALIWKPVESILKIEPKENGLIDRIDSILSWKEFSPEEKQIIKAVIDRNRKPLELMLQASEKTCFQYDDWHKPFYQKEIPKVFLFIRAIKLLIADSIIKLEEGQSIEALDQMIKGINFARLLADSCDFLCFMFAQSNALRLIQNLNFFIADKNLSEDEARKIIGSLDPERWRNRLIRTIKARLNNDLDYYDILFQHMSIAYVDVLWLDSAMIWLFKPLLKSEMIWMLRHYDDLIQRVEKPFYQIPDNYFFFEPDNVQNPKIPFYYGPAKTLFINYAWSIKRQAALEALQNAAIAGLGCKLYKQKYGKYPETLSALVPEILKEEPLDPITGQPLIYKANEKGFIVYSVGFNKKDDEGRMSRLEKKILDKDDDWSWRDNW